MTERLKAEYDSFGPWALAVRLPEELPPLFDPWWDEVEGSGLILKIPRGIERREARPGDDLYESLIAVGERGVVHLEARAGAPRLRAVAYGEIAGVARILELLAGELRFDLVDGSRVSVPFNAVSAPAIDEFVDRVRAGCAAAGGGRSFSPAELSAEPSSENVLFVNLLHELRRRNPGLGLAAYQPPCQLPSRKGQGRSGIAGWAARLLRWRLDGFMLAVGPAELVLIVNGTGRPRTRRVKGYRYEALYLPAAGFRGATTEPRTLANGAVAHILRLSLTGHDYELYLENPPSELLDQWLARAAVREE